MRFRQKPDLDFFLAVPYTQVMENNLAVQTESKRIRIDFGNRSYDILIGSGLLHNAEAFANLPAAQTAFIISNDTVAPLYGKQLQAALQNKYKRIHLVSLPDGEEFKNWQTLNQIFDTLLRQNADRKSVLFALGGGVVGDMAGFAAACYMRGVPYVQIPTTLLAQVDSSVGGKTAINHPLGKNMIGSFYQPHRVVCDLNTLKTLPAREFSAGLAEVIKYGPIADPEFFDWLESNLPALLAKDLDALGHAVQRCCQIKALVVAKDEREGDQRAILNFGHTFGHAMESGLGYGVWLHGEAVAAGMVMAAELSRRLGLVDASLVGRLTALLDRAGLPTKGPLLPANSSDADYTSLSAVQRYLHWMRHDKKAEAGFINYVLLDGWGKALVKAVPDDHVAEVIAACCT